MDANGLKLSTSTTHDQRWVGGLLISNMILLFILSYYYLIINNKIIIIIIGDSNPPTHRWSSVLEGPPNLQTSKHPNIQTSNFRAANNLDLLEPPDIEPSESPESKVSLSGPTQSQQAVRIWISWSLQTSWDTMYGDLQLQSLQTAKTLHGTPRWVGGSGEAVTSRHSASGTRWRLWFRTLPLTSLRTSQVLIACEKRSKLTSELVSF